MAIVKVFYDQKGNTLTVWFDDPQDEHICEETGDEVVLMENKSGRVIGFEKLNFSVSKPGEALQINKRDKAYARIELIGEMDDYDRVLNAIENLPEPKGKLRAVAQNYKSKLYGN